MAAEAGRRASEILALNVEDLDLEQRRAPIRSNGGDTEFVHWDTGAAAGAFVTEPSVSAVRARSGLTGPDDNSPMAQMAAILI